MQRRAAPQGQRTAAGVRGSGRPGWLAQIQRATRCLARAARCRVGVASSKSWRGSRDRANATNVMSEADNLESMRALATRARVAARHLGRVDRASKDAALAAI